MYLYSIQVPVQVHCLYLGVNDVRHSLHPLDPLQCLEEHPPGRGLAAAAGAHHHEPVVEPGDLVELQDLHGGGGEGGRKDRREGGWAVKGERAETLLGLSSNIPIGFCLCWLVVVRTDHHFIILTITLQQPYCDGYNSGTKAQLQ